MAAVASLSPTELAVDPGSAVTATIRVRNTGSIVDRFDIDVVGVAGWVRVDPASLSLFPGAEGTATITFAPPRASMPRAGTVAFGVRVRPETDPAGSTVEEGRVTVAPFSAVTADIAPQTSRGSRAGRHEVVVENRGNAPVEVVVSAVDPDRRLGLAVEPARAVIGPEQQTSFRVMVRADDPYPFGPRRPRPFEVSVIPGRQAPIPLRATLSQGPLLPGWIPPLGGIAAALVLAAGLALATGIGPFAPKAIPSPSLAAVASEAPSSGPSVEPSSEPPSVEPSAEGPSSPPTEPPTEPPLSLGEFSLSVTGDEVALGNGLALRCAPNDAACRDAAKDTIRTIVQELQNPYSGAGIPSTRSLGVANTLPVILTAPRDFPWKQLGAGETGETQTAVIDLGPLLANQTSYVYAVVDTADGQTRRFVVDSAFAKQLFDLLYQLPPEMGPVVAATPPPNMDLGQLIVADPIIWDIPFVLFSPTP